MTCEEMGELLAAHALGALSPEEAREVRAHLATCRRHDTELTELRGVVSLLPLAAPEREPSPELRARLLEAYEAERANQGQPIVPIRAGVRWGVFWRNFGYLAAAAVLVLAVVGLAAWNLVLQLGDGDDGAATVVAEFAEVPGSGRVVYVPEEGVAVMELNLPELPEERTYQAWRIEGGTPISLGLVPNEGIVAMDVDLGNTSAVAISEEPAGGSEQPTTVVVTAELPS